MRRLLALGLIVLGVVCLAWFATATVRRMNFQRQQAAALNRSLAEPSAVIEVPVSRPPHRGLVGRLEIPRVHLSAIVVEGDDDATLEEAVGHLPDTVMPWERGNSALAGHRDTFFRPLQHVKPGDEVRLTSPRGTFIYRVEDAHVTTPEDIGVLAQTTSPVLTLLTCYPFHYVGSAPERFVVRAARVETQSGGPASEGDGASRDAALRIR
jgi:sortase A